MFLSRTLATAENKYWATELEVSCIVWTLRKVRHLIESSKQQTIIYTDHSATIAISTSLRTVSTEGLNRRLVRAAMFIQTFNVKVYHRPGKSNKVADALSRLPSKRPTAANGDDDLETYALSATTMQLSDEFRQKVIPGYDTDTRWSTVRQPLLDSATQADPIAARLPYTLQDDLLFAVQDDGLKYCCDTTKLDNA